MNDQNTMTKWFLVSLVAGMVVGQSAVAEFHSFPVSLDPAFQKDRFSGRVYVVVSDNLDREPRRSMGNWFNSPHIFARDVTNHSPYEPVVISDRSLAFPEPLAALKGGEYHIQAIARRNLDSPSAGRGAGDLYSKPQIITLDTKKTEPISLRLNQVVKERTFTETDRLKLVEIKSTALSAFHGREFKIRAGVVLPAGWSADSDQKYPALYMVPGFGGNHRMARFFLGGRAGDTFDNVLMVVPDPSCYRGHSVFADSQNNGPWGFALVHELIPEIEKRYRGTQSGEHRYVTGVSSGGWSSLWLQVAYPEEFNGCWAHAPDPVDFHDFQQIDLYKPGGNMYTDEEGNRRPLARRDGKIALYYDDFVHREDVLGPGGQIHSFEAVFSRRMSNGLPELLFNRKTGEIFAETVDSWKPYDIRRVLERNWDILGPKLKGKIHVYGGEFDTFYLEGAVRRLKKTLEELGSDADVRVIDGMGHGMYRESLEPMMNTIEENFQKAFGKLEDKEDSANNKPDKS